MFRNSCAADAGRLAVSQRRREMRNGKTALVTGAGGFIGHHLVKYLVGYGYVVRGADLKYTEYEGTSADEFEIADLRDYNQCLRVTENVDEVYHLAAHMGGIGYNSSFHDGNTINHTLLH